MLPLISGIIARVLLAAALVNACAGCELMGTPPRDQVMRMERAHGLALDAIEGAVAAGQLDDVARRNVVRAAEGQMNAQIEAARQALAAAPGVKLADDSGPVARFEAAKKRFDDALAAAKADADREAAARERRRNDFFSALLAPAAAGAGAATKAGTP